MHLVLRTKNVELTPALRTYAEEKLAEMASHLPESVPVELELAEETRARHLAEATVFAKGQTIRASKQGATLRAAIDGVAEMLERQVIRYRDKRRLEPRRRVEHRGAS